MRIVSAFRQAPERALATLRRFPNVLLAGAFLAAVVIAEIDGAPGERLLMAALLAVIISFDLTLLKERFGVSDALGQPAVLMLSAGLIALLYVSIDLVGRGVESTFDAESVYYSIAVDDPIRLAAFAVGLHALAAAIPFIGRGSITGFWDYNRTLFLRILSSALFSGVLFGGLALALWAVETLLGLEIPDDTYGHLFALMAGVVNTWFFLAGVPSGATAGESESEAQSEAVYPKGLKVFVQFVLLPLTAVYLVILYLYVARITIEWELPKGQVSYLIFSYAVIGILAYLLIHPLRDDEENHWVRTFARGFFIALAPLLVVLIVALTRRVGDYGLTEPRYYGIVLAGWLALVVAYFLSRREDIRFIPTSLAIGALLASIGPWGATGVSVRSQVALLASIMERPKPYTEEQTSSVRSIAEFLAERGRLADAAVLVSTRPDTVQTSADLVAAIGVDPAWLAEEDRRNLHFYFTSPTSLSLGGFTELIEIDGSFDSLDVQSESLGRVVLRWRRPGVLAVDAAGTSIDLHLDSVAASLGEPAVRTAMPRDPRPESPNVKSGHDGSPPHIAAVDSVLRVRLVLQWLSGSRLSDSTATATALGGRLLIGRVESE